MTFELCPFFCVYAYHIGLLHSIVIAPTHRILRTHLGIRTFIIGLFTQTNQSSQIIGLSQAKRWILNESKIMNESYLLKVEPSDLGNRIEQSVNLNNLCANHRIVFIVYAIVRQQSD